MDPMDPAYPACRLNEELNLPEKYIAVQIRRGDKVAGNRKVHLLWQKHPGMLDAGGMEKPTAE